MAWQRMTLVVTASLSPPCLEAVRVMHTMNHTTRPTREELPPCPCTIYNGFCDVQDLNGHAHPPYRPYMWGVSCVASEDALITMPWQVQCVPMRNGGIDYNCPELLPSKCNPETVQNPCDTSMLARCSRNQCGGGTALKSLAQRPSFCSLDTCTVSECCDDCPADAHRHPRWGRCVNGRNRFLAASCCQEAGRGPDLSGLSPEQLCLSRINTFTTPVHARLSAYSEVCGFTPADVDYHSTTFGLRSSSRPKLCTEECQANHALSAAPLDIYSAAEALSDECPDQAFQSQLTPVGLFSAARALDAAWRDCRTGGPDVSGEDDGEFETKDDGEHR